MKSLKEMCKIEVIKLGISGSELPTTVAKEVEIMEENIKSAFTGIFSYSEYFSSSTLKIDWVGGEWQFTQLNQQTIKIKAGAENSLGNLGGDLFLFPGRKVSINDYRIDLEGRKVIFYGTFSSVKDVSGRQFKSTLLFSSTSNLLMMESKVSIKETGLDKEMARMFMKSSTVGSWVSIRDSYDDSESDSSVDYGDLDAIE
jgi:hypothetical protein